MRIIILLTLVVSMYAQKVLLINSNTNIEKYKSVENSFKKSFNKPFETIDISKMSKEEIKEYLYDEYPDVVYSIGVKAYQYTNLYIPEKTIFFSSIINYKRLNLQNNRFGVSNELHAGMNLTIIKSLFFDIKKLNIIYSKYTQDLYESFKENAKKLGVEIIGEKLFNSSSLNVDKLNISDGLILLPDPILLKDENRVYELFRKIKQLKKPIFAYDKLFLDYGATLAISAHNPTIGNQIALMIGSHLKNSDFNNIQIPAGTEVIFNKKVADKLELKYNEFAISVVDKVIE